MTVLVDHEILDWIKHELIIVEPFDRSLINPSSLDIRLGNSIHEIKSTIEGGLINPLDKSSFYYRKVSIENSTYILKPNSFVLAPMLEKITLKSKRVAAKLLGKSSMARLGLSNSDAAGWCDNGWDGVLTQELFNHSTYPIVLTKGMRIGQLIFFRTETPMRDYSQTGKYQNQTPGMGSLGVSL